MVYLGFLAIILIMLIAGSTKGVSLKTYIFVPLLFLALLTGLRYETGSDLINYQLVFDWVSIGRYTDYEISYTLICRLVQLIHGKFQLVVLLYALTSYYFIYKALNNICTSKLEIASFICFFYSIMFSTYFILMRQFMAASIILYAISRNDEKKIYRYFFFILAGLFHYGAFVVIPFYLIINSKLLDKNWKRILALILTVVAGRGLFSLDIVGRLMSVFTRYEYYTDKINYGTSTTLSVMVVLFTIIYVLVSIIYFRNDLKKGSSIDDWVLSIDIEGKGILLTLIIYFGTIMVGWFHRAYWYSYMFIAFLPSWSSQVFITRKNKKLLQYIWILLSLVYAIYFYKTLEQTMPNMFPYKWSFELF